MSTPVHIVAGFLGTGKTTTLLGLLRSRPATERVAVVVNDFGTASIDGSVVSADGGVRVDEISGACVCCTAPEGFTAAIGRLLDEVSPDRIFVEPTGLARPSDLVDTLRRGPHAARVDVGPVIALVDPASGDLDRTTDQVEAADVLVVNRVDLASAHDLARIDRWVASLWPAPPRVIRTSYGVLPPDVLDARRIAHASDHAHEHGHDSTANHVATSRVWGGDVEFSHRRVVGAMDALARSGAARAKGLFRTDEGTWLVEVAGGRVHERTSAWRRDSRADVIVAAGSDAGGVWAPFEEARLGDDERSRTDQIELTLPDGRRPRLDRDGLAALPDGVPDVSVLLPKRQGAAARLSALLDRHGVRDDDELVVVASDGLVTPPVPAGALRTAVVVHTPGPFRLLVPGDAGPAGPCSNVKGVVRIVVRRPGTP
jgi:G3E family GTPase